MAYVVNDKTAPQTGDNLVALPTKNVVTIPQPLIEPNKITRTTITIQ